MPRQICMCHGFYTNTQTINNRELLFGVVIVWFITYLWVIIRLIACYYLAQVLMIVNLEAVGN